MARFFATSALLIVITELTAAPVATAAEASQAEYLLGDTVPLSESDLQKMPEDWQTRMFEQEE